MLMAATKRRAKLPAALSPGEEAFALAWRAHGFTTRLGLSFLREFKFSTERDWRFDFAWPDARVAVEIEGGTKGRSRHTQHAGFKDDCVKYNTAAMWGWCVIRLTPDMVDDGWILLIKSAVEGRTGRL